MIKYFVIHDTEHAMWGTDIPYDTLEAADDAAYQEWWHLTDHDKEQCYIFGVFSQEFPDDAQPADGLYDDDDNVIICDLDYAVEHSDYIAAYREAKAIEAYGDTFYFLTEDWLDEHEDEGVKCNSDPKWDDELKSWTLKIEFENRPGTYILSCPERNGKLKLTRLD